MAIIALALDKAKPKIRKPEIELIIYRIENVWSSGNSNYRPQQSSLPTSSAIVGI